MLIKSSLNAKIVSMLGELMKCMKLGTLSIRKVCSAYKDAVDGNIKSVEERMEKDYGGIARYNTESIQNIKWEEIWICDYRRTTIFETRYS